MPGMPVNSSLQNVFKWNVIIPSIYNYIFVVYLLSLVQLFVIPWTIACQAPLSIEFSRQEYWSSLPFPSSRDLPNPGIKLSSPALQADSLPSEPQGKPQSCSLTRAVPKETIQGLLQSGCEHWPSQVAQPHVCDTSICTLGGKLKRHIAIKHFGSVPDPIPLPSRCWACQFQIQPSSPVVAGEAE